MHYPYRDNATVQYRAFPKRSPHHSNPTRHSIFDHEERQIISVNVSVVTNNNSVLHFFGLRPAHVAIRCHFPDSFYLTPVSSAGGVVIKAGSLIAVLILRQTNNYNSDDFQFVWNIYANNDVVVPTGGCDVSARDVTVTLPDYPGSVPIPLTVYCAKSQNLGYYLSGTTADAGNSIFTNTASFSPAQGVGVQLTRNGTIIPANNTVSLGAVGTSAVSLGLTANYARTGGQVTAGNVQSIIGVTFVYQ